MFDNVSASATSGLAAASRRLEASASNVANADSRGALPVGEAANAPGDAREPYVPVRVEQSSAADGGTVTNERPDRPPYIPVFDATSALANESSSVAAPDVDLAEETVEQVDAQQAFTASAGAHQSLQELVRSLYDLPE